MRRPWPVVLTALLGLAVAGVVCALLLLDAGNLGREGVPAASQPAPAPPSDWPGFHGAGPLLGSAAFAPEPPLEVLWAFKAKEGIEGSAAVTDGVVFFGDQGGTLYAIDLATGGERWTWPAGSAAPAASAPATTRSARRGAFAATPLVASGRVFIGDTAGVFRAFDAKTGQLLWELPTENQIQSSANLAGDLVVFGSYDHHLYAVRPDDGHVVWKHESGNYVHCAPAAGGVAAEVSVYIAGCDEVLTAVSAATGDVTDTGDLGGYAAASAVVLDDRVVAATMGGKVAAFDRLNLHQRLWEYTVEDCEFYASPAAAEGIVVLGGRDHRVRAVDAVTGTEAWTFETQGQVDSSPAIGGGRVYVGSEDGRLYVLDLQTGRSLWSFVAGRAIKGSPAIASGIVLVGDTGGTLYALGRRSVPARGDR